MKDNLEKDSNNGQTKGKWYISLPIILVTMVFCLPISLILTIVRLTTIKKQRKGYRAGTFIAVGLQIICLVVGIIAATYEEPWKKEYQSFFDNGEYAKAQEVLDNKSGQGFNSTLAKYYLGLAEATADYSGLVNYVNNYYESLEDKSEFDSDVLSYIEQSENNLSWDQKDIVMAIQIGITEAKAKKESEKLETEETETIVAETTLSNVESEMYIENEMSNPVYEGSVAAEETEDEYVNNSNSYYTVFTCQYPKAFSKDRKRALKAIENLSGEKVSSNSVFLKRSANDEYTQTLDNQGLVYFGKIKNGKPDGFGVIVQDIDDMVDDAVKAGKHSTVNGYAYGAIYPDFYFLMDQYMPLYAGEFKDGLYDGYGLKLDYYGIKEEGEYKKGKLAGNGISYYNLCEESKSIFESDTETWIMYCEGLSRESGTILNDYPVLIPAVHLEGEFGKGEFSGKKQKVYYINYGTQKTDQGTRHAIYHSNSNYGPLAYEGEMKEGKQHGKGTEYYVNGNKKYDGEYKKGEMHGKGKLYNEDGSVKYDGKFKNGDIAG